MRLNKVLNFKKMHLYPAIPGVSVKRSLVWGRRQIGPLCLVLALSACAGNPLKDLNLFKTEVDESLRGSVGFVQGFIGGVVADEPRATLIGRDILSSGGTAADAAVAVSFALSVTLPSSASLGGGGVCLIHDAETNTTETLDFLAGIPQRIPSTAIVPTAVPGFVRGLAALHSKYGRLKWTQLISPAETLARFGNQVSRAFATDLKQLPSTQIVDPEFFRILGKKNERRFIKEGEFLKQLDLSSVLGRLRARGAGDFHLGLMARQLVNAVTEAGGSLSLEDLRAYTPHWRPTLKIPYIKNTKFHFPISAGLSGALAGQMVGMLIEHDDWKDASPAERAHLMAEVSGRAYAARSRWLRKKGLSAVRPSRLVSQAHIKDLFAGYQAERHLRFGGGGTMPATAPGNFTGTGFVIVDLHGSAVACSLTLNNLFGAGRIAPGMGILLAGLPGPLGRGPDSVSAVLLINDVHNLFHFGAAASGGNPATSAMAGVAAGTLFGRDEEDLERALRAKRLHNNGVPDITYYEQGLNGAITEDLSKRGHQLSPAPPMGLVNAIFCATGIPQKEEMSCAIRQDPRGFGLGAGAE
ncbi:MAG: gamma-glutamyltransferase [Rhodospirillales bacterium]